VKRQLTLVTSEGCPDKVTFIMRANGYSPQRPAAARVMDVAQLKRFATPPKDLSSPYGQLYGAVVSWCAWEALYVALYVPLVARLVLPRKGAAADPAAAPARLWRIKLVNALHGALVGPVGIYALYLSDEFTKDATTAALTFDGAWLRNNLLTLEDLDHAPALCCLTVGFLAWDLMHSPEWDERDWLLALSRLVAILAWPVAITQRVAHWFILVFISFEVSSPLLQATWLTRTAYGAHSSAHFAASASCSLKFLLFRTTSIPFLAFAYLQAKPWACDEQPCAISHPHLRALTAVCLALPSLLNVLGTLRIFAGAAKLFEEKEVDVIPADKLKNIKDD